MGNGGKKGRVGREKRRREERKEEERERGDTKDKLVGTRLVPVSLCSRRSSN